MKEYRSILLFFLIFFSELPLVANQYFIGYSQVEAGDDIFRPAICLRSTILDEYFFLLNYDARLTGAIRSQSLIPAVGMNFPLNTSSSLSGSMGFSLQFDYLSSSYPEDGKSEINYNIGIVLGLKAIIATYPLWYLAWDSHIFPAGAATLVLVTSRRQYLSFGVGLDL